MSKKKDNIMKDINSKDIQILIEKLILTENITNLSFGYCLN